MKGNVDTRRRSLLPLLVRGPFGHEHVSAAIDTGFTGHISLPGDLVSRLGLQFYGDIFTVDSSGRVSASDGYVVEIEWLGGPVTCVGVENKIQQVLIGTALLDGHVLEIDFGSAKTVEVR